MSNPPPSRKRILIIEDDRDIRETLQDVLELEGYGVTSVADGQDALNLLQAGNLPGLILLDLMMPRMSGWEFLERRREDSLLASIPVLVLSASQAKDWPAGANAYLRKPVSINELLEKVGELCG